MGYWGVLVDTTGVLMAGPRGYTHANPHTHTRTHTRAHTCKHTRACACERVHVVGLCVRMGLCVRATRVCVFEPVSVVVSLNPSACACARGCARVRVRARVCRSDPCGCVQFMCVFASSCARISVRARVRVCAHARARARAGLCICAFVCACERVLPVHRQASSRMCVSVFACVCVCMCASRRLCERCGRTAATCSLNSSAGGAARPRVRGCGVVRSALGVARVRPQV